MGFFDLFKKKNIVSKGKEKKIQKSWLDITYMSGYDIGEVKGYTDLIEKPRYNEKGKDKLLKWERYGDFLIITGITNKNVQLVEIPKSIKGYTVVGIERMAFMYCSIQTMKIPDTVTYIGGMAVGFTSESPFSDEQEREIRAKHPLAENFPTSTFMNKEFYLHTDPKTLIIGAKNTTAEKYSISHKLPFSEI